MFMQACTFSLSIGVYALRVIYKVQYVRTNVYVHRISGLGEVVSL